MNKISIRKIISKPFILISIIVVSVIGILLILSIRSNTTPLKKSTKPENLPENVDVRTVSGVLAEYDLDALLKRSDLVVYGRVTEIMAPIAIKSIYGDIHYATDIKIAVNETYRGSSSENITIRTSGGLIGDTYYEYLEEPNIFLDESYIFMLSSPIGLGFDTDGDYYYISGVHQGLFKTVNKNDISALEKYSESMDLKNPDDVYLINTTFFDDQGNLQNQFMKNADYIHCIEDIESNDLQSNPAILTVKSFKEVSKVYNSKYPVDKNFIRNEILNSYEKNLKNGFMTQEEFDTAMEFFEEHAEIIHPSTMAEDEMDDSIVMGVN